MENYRHGKDITYVECSLCIPNGSFTTGVDLCCSYSSWCFTDTTHPLQHLRKNGRVRKTRWWVKPPLKRRGGETPPPPDCWRYATLPVIDYTGPRRGYCPFRQKPQSLDFVNEVACLVTCNWLHRPYYLVGIRKTAQTLNMFMGVKQFCTPRSREIFIILRISSIYKMLDNDLTNRF